MGLPREAISCQLCKEPIQTVEPRTPVVLGCFHTFCRQCLAGWAKGGGALAATNGDGVAGAGSFSCPTCRAVCTTPVPDLPLNYALVTVIEVEQVSTGQAPLVCHACDDEATHICQDCDQLMCEDCTKVHRKGKATKDHVLQTAVELKERKQALPKQKRLCKKHKDQALTHYCSTCQIPICMYDLVGDHICHEYSELHDIANKHKGEMCKEADEVTGVQKRLEAAIDRIKAEEVVVETVEAEQQGKIATHFDELVAALRRREVELVEEVKAAAARKLKALAGQREGLEYAVSSMASGSEYARRTATLGDAVEVTQAYSYIVGGMRGLRDKEYELDPCTRARIEFVDETDGGMSEGLSRHARVVVREVWPGACTAEGPGLAEVLTGAPSAFTVRAIDHRGQPCAAGGDVVQVRMTGLVRREEEGSRGQEAGQPADVGRQAEVEDNGDGTYSVRYSVAEGAMDGQTADLAVLVNGGHVAGSPFTVAVVRGVELTWTAPFDDKGVLHHIATAGGTQAYSNPHDAGLVVASMSGSDGDPRRFVQGSSHDGKHNHTDNIADSWMAVDLRRELAPTHYCLRSDKCTACHKMRTWRLEGSNDGRSWTTLRQHTDDTSLTDTAFSVASWPIEAAGTFRHFRILQTGKSSSGHDHLMCAGIELYGRLHEAAEA